MNPFSCNEHYSQITQSSNVRHLKTFTNVHIKISQNIMLGITQSQQMEKTSQGMTLGIIF